VHFLVKEILPHVRAEIPEARLLLVGDNAPPDIEAYASDGVRLLGHVPDLDPLMARARVFVAPLRFGAGVKGKIGEALAYGLPVVTTAVGAEGMWRKLSERGRRHVEQNFTPEVVGSVINDSVRSERNGGRAARHGELKISNQ
jgi:hypothetical protein